jgi:S1-C subfamily serine protease
MKRSTAIGLGIILVAAGAASGGPRGQMDEEARRIDLIARLERSVVVVFAEGREISHQKSLLALLPSESLGTGVVLSSDGLILTAAHVVAGAERVRVKLLGGEPLPARVVFADDAADVALLRLETIPAGLTPARLGDSDGARKGETVYVIGNPIGIEFSLSSGVISGRHPGSHVFGGSVEAEVIQTDAAINSGNSGGPIFNSRGEVIAVAQSILTQGGGFEGLGFGLSINTVKKILGLDPCTWLGLSGVPLDEASAGLLNVPAPSGLLVERVTPGGPADQAGIRGGEKPIQVGREHILLGGDVILKVDGLPVLDWMRKPPPAGAEVGERHELKLTILRAGRIVELPIVTVHRAVW